MSFKAGWPYAAGAILLGAVGLVVRDFALQ
jgi:hypothetical protein